MNRPVILEGLGIWKLYGAHPETFLKRHNYQPTDE